MLALYSRPAPSLGKVHNTLYALHVIACAAGYNICWLMCWIAFLWVFIQQRLTGWGRGFLRGLCPLLLRRANAPVLRHLLP